VSSLARPPTLVPCVPPPSHAHAHGQVAKEIAKIEKKMLGAGDAKARSALPLHGIPAKQVLAEAKKLYETDVLREFEEGKSWGGVYYDHRKHTNALPNLQADLLGVYNSTNALYPGVFPAIRKFEAEIIKMTVRLPLR